MQHCYIINQTNYTRKTEIFGIKIVIILNKNIKYIKIETTK